MGEIVKAEPQTSGLTEELNNGSTVFRKDGKVVGLVSQNPVHPDVMEPGKWNAVIHTADEGLWSFGTFNTAEEAKVVEIQALGRNWTYEQWAQEEAKK